MHFDVNIRPAEIPANLRCLTEITGAAAWQKRENDFAHQVRDNPLIAEYLDSHFRIERSMFNVKRYKQNTGRIPNIIDAPSDNIAVLYNFASVVTHVFRHLPKNGQDALRQKMKGALDDEVGLSPLAFEMRTVAHFVASGFDVEFHDLCEGGGFDFLVRKAEIQMEVECKSASGDLGHRVHLRRQCQLGLYILPPMRATEKDGVVKLLVVTLPDRLYPAREFMIAVGARIGEALTKFEGLTEGEPCTVSYREFPIAGSPFDCKSPPRINQNDVIEYCNTMIGDQIGHTIMTFSPRRSATVVALRSAKPNSFMDYVYRSLKEAASKQLSGTRPGIICVQLRDMTSTQLQDIAVEPSQSGKPSAVQLMTAKFFDSGARNHVHTLAYIAPGNFVRSVSRRPDLHSPDIIQDTIVSEDAISYWFGNRNHPQFADCRYDVFRKQR
jgi:hypothetical protein